MGSSSVRRRSTRWQSWVDQLTVNSEQLTARETGFPVLPRKRPRPNIRSGLLRKGELFVGASLATRSPGIDKAAVGVPLEGRIRALARKQAMRMSHGHSGEPDCPAALDRIRGRSADDFHADAWFVPQAELLQWLRHKRAGMTLVIAPPATLLRIAHPYAQSRAQTLDATSCGAKPETPFRALLTIHY